MNRNDFLDLISQFCKRLFPATSGRHVYLWHGDLGELRGNIPKEILIVFDLHQLVSDLSKSPYNREEASRLLQKAIRNRLYESVKFDKQLIIGITGCDLLSRYKVPLIDFFTLSSETMMFVFIVPTEETLFKPNLPLPAYISLNPSATFDYLRDVIGETNTIDLSESGS